MWRKRFSKSSSDTESGYDSLDDSPPPEEFFQKTSDFRFTPSRVLKAIQNTAIGKAYDSPTQGMNPRMFNCASAAVCLSVAFNHICTKSKAQPTNPIFNFYLRPTLKSSSKPKDIEKSYRPLAISGLPLVFYERVLCSYMEKKVDQSLPETSYAYRPGRGASMAILKLKMLLQQKGAIAFFLDASDAFGCIKWQQLFDIMRKKGFDENLIAAIGRLYRLSCGRVVWRGESSMTFVFQSGVRQGGSISGHLFNLYFSCLDIIGNRGVMIFYADDLVIVVFHPWAAVSVLHELAELSQQMNINWNPDKCKVLHMAVDSRHDFEFYGKILENVSRFVYLGWIIVNKRTSIDDEQAARQACRLYAAAHETSQAYQFTRQLPWNERVNFAKTFGGLYAPECFTSLSAKALSRLRGAHRYLYMKLTGWEGEECFDEEASVSSLSIGSDDSAEEYYDKRSRWLYAYAATNEKLTKFRGIRNPYGTEWNPEPVLSMDIYHLKPAPSVEYQLRKAQYRIKVVSRKLCLGLDMEEIRFSKSLVKVVSPV